MGSSSSSRSGWDSSSRHSATRRFSPPDRLVTSASGRRAAQRVHGLLDLAVQVPGVPVVELLLQAAHLLEQLVGVVGRHLLGDLVVLLEQLLGLGHAVLDVAEHGLGLVQLRLLGEQAHGEAGHQARLAVGRLLHAGHHPQQGRLAGTVRAHDADLRAGQERQRDVVEDDLVAVRLAHGSHLIDELRHVLKPTGTRRLPRHLPGPPAAPWHPRLLLARSYRRTWFRPASLARYRARSAAASSSNRSLAVLAEHRHPDRDRDADAGVVSGRRPRSAGPRCCAAARRSGRRRRRRCGAAGR